MKRFLSGLQTEILLSLAVLLVAAMTLTSFIVMRVWEGDLLRQQAAEGKALIQSIQAAVDTLATGDKGLSKELVRKILQAKGQWMFPPGLLEQIIIRGKDGALWVGKEGPRQALRLRGAALSSALNMKRQAFRIHKGQRSWTVTSPLFVGQAPMAVVQVPVRMDSVLQGVKRSQKVIWFYIALNVAVLLVFGGFLLSRIVIRPIKRLVKTADDFVETQEPFPLGSQRHGNEMAHLALSLNRMLKRLSENEEQLEAQIQSLEKANEELKEAHEVILHSEKLACLGRLAAGVAHEVGNPLGTILGYADLLTTHLENDLEAKDYLARMQSEISRINAIIRELLDYSRSSTGDPAPVDVNTVITEAVSFFSHQKITASIDLKTRLDKEVGIAWGDPDQLKQVLINLLFNAYDALGETGQILIRSGRRPGPTSVAAPGVQPEWIEIGVSDTGQGVPPSDQEKIFAPFFTTKPPGKGTGLGLAISRRIVESFGGTLEVDSKGAGKGSTFTMTLGPWKPDDDTKRSYH